MAAFPKLVLTSAGIALQTKVQGGATLELTNIQMGSGQLNGQPIGPLTALISSNTTVPIQSGQAIGQNTYQVEGFFTNADLSAGFWWREIGIFANDPDNGEILYAYANAGDAGDYIPTVTDQRIEKYIYFSMTLANATTVTVTIPQTDTYVLQSTVGQANGVAGLGENGAVPVAQGGTGATTAQDAVVALGALFAIAAAAAYNSSGTYAIGDYCTNDGNLYKCNTPIESGETWTEAHWTTTTVAAEMQELSSQLSNLESALTTPPQEFSLPLSTGWSTNNGCLYRKTQDSMVVIIAQFVLNSGATASDSMELATLPEGFRPSSYLIVPACMQDGSERLSCVVQISTSGKMIYNGKANTTSVFRVYLNTSFFAAS